MRRLRHPPADEEGAIVVLMIVVSLVIIVMAALVVDVGGILDEKRQLQNGADAAALGVAQLIAQTCPTGPCTSATLVSTAESLAGANARDGATRIDAVTPDYTAQRVAVTTSTADAGGGRILPYWFGKAVTGSPGRTVHAKATASWAGLARAAVIPLTISKCEYTRTTVGGTVFDVATVVLFHTKATSCVGPSGSDLPGGFGWLKDNNDSNPNDCSVTPSVNATVPDDSGVPGTPNACDVSTLLGKDILLAVYDSFTGTGSNAIYRIYGFAQVHLTGYRFSSSNAAGTIGCSSPNTCISGSFIRFTAVGDYGGPNLGNRVALLS